MVWAGRPGPFALLPRRALPGKADPCFCLLCEPGNRRHIAVAFASAAELVAPPDLSLRAEIVMDGQPFSFVVTKGAVAMEAGEMLAPPLRYATRYETLRPVAAGEMTFAEHLARFAEVENLDGPDPAPFLELLEKTFAVFGGAE